MYAHRMETIFLKLGTARPLRRKEKNIHSFLTFAVCFSFGCNFPKNLQQVCCYGQTARWPKLGITKRIMGFVNILNHRVHKEHMSNSTFNLGCASTLDLYLHCCLQCLLNGFERLPFQRHAIRHAFHALPCSLPSPTPEPCRLHAPFLKTE